MPDTEALSQSPLQPAPSPRRTAKPRDTDPFTICVDTREQLPYTFSSIRRAAFPWFVRTIGLRTGDCQLACDEWASDDESCRIVVERKTLSDLYSTMSSRRTQFKAEFTRMAQFGYAALVIESPWCAVARPDAHLRMPTRMNPRSVVQSLLAWSIRYHVHLFACPDRGFAEQLTFRLLEWWERLRRRGELPQRGAPPASPSPAPPPLRPRS